MIVEYLESHYCFAVLAEVGSKSISVKTLFVDSEFEPGEDLFWDEQNNQYRVIVPMVETGDQDVTLTRLEDD